MLTEGLCPFVCCAIWIGLALLHQCGLTHEFNDYCGEDEFQCFDGMCIDLSERCDGTNNCNDMSDEKYCAAHCVVPLYFPCENGKCVSISFVCDGENSCGDNSDEKNCSHVTEDSMCPENEFKCLDGLCIPDRWVCDDKNDCLDGSDETLGCSTKISCDDGFKCKNHHCIPIEWKCDGSPDCTDNSDEENCEAKPVNISECTTSNKRFLCSDHSKCLEFHKVCNFHNDCNDSSDEGGDCANRELCKRAKCEFDCKLLPDGPLCICPEGYQTKNGTCEDINECNVFGTCDQRCNNTDGSYTCYCVSGYNRVEDKYKCEAEGGEALLIFSSFKQVRAYFLTSGIYYPVATKLSHVTGVAYDGMSIYWSSVKAGHETIIKSTEDGSKQEIIVTAGLGFPEDLAIDWVTQNLYFTDSLYKQIGVCTNNGLFCTVLHNIDIDKPRAIVLQPEEGLMYWTDWGKRPLIARSGMDGSNVIDFVTENIHWPNGITIDHGNERLYWVDAKFSIIECIKLDGSDRQKVAESVNHPYSIAVFEDMIYWSDWSGNEIKACNKFTGKNCKTIMREKKDKIYGIHIYHPSMEEKHVVNPCSPTHCSELCLLAPRRDHLDLGYSCACSEDKTLSPNKHGCRLKDKIEYLMIGYGHTVIKLEHKNLGKQVTSEIHLPSVSKIGALTYDPVTGRVIVSDLLGKKIVAFDMITSQQTILIDSQVGKIVGLDFDVYGNNLYWVDEERETVEVMSLTTMARTVLINDLGGDTPCDIALIPDEGVMFVALHDGLTIHIDRMYMDGSLSSRTHVIEGLLGPRVALEYDKDLHRVYWVDSGTGYITSTDHEGVGRHKYRELVTAPVDITFLGKDMFWVNHGSNTVYWVDKYDGEKADKNLILSQAEGFDDFKLTAVTGVVAGQKHVCQINNGQCSHICLLAGVVKVCACPTGMELETDKQTCRKVVNCKSDEYKCSSGECIPSSFRCNKKTDCLNNDDEWNCAEAKRDCPPYSFACHDGKECVGEHRKCDFIFDCEDKSDELDCSVTEACNGESTFHCGSGECISNAWRCDEKGDCEDRSDEDDCKYNKCNATTQFRCNYGGCIPKSWECDKQLDCPDASDEHEGCSEKNKCESHLFTCGNQNCVDQNLVCNGMNDCEDNSDEKYCIIDSVTEYGTLEDVDEHGGHTVVCNETEFACESEPDVCLPHNAKCNGTLECLKGEDEIGCIGCPVDEFECPSDHICVPRSWVCDGVYDCVDKSDEDPTSCGHLNNKIKPKWNDECDSYQCQDNGNCIPFNKLCDKHFDCEDGSDEGGLCGTGCKNADCSDKCIETPSGPKCSCSRGYKLQGDARNCIDINECDMKYSCSQSCKNLQGSYKCSCIHPMYQLRDDRKRCKAKGPEMEYIYTSQGEIRFKTVSLSRTGIIYKINSEIPIDGMAINTKAREIFWTSEKLGTLTKMSLDTPEKVEKITNIIKPTKISYDWITGNIYLVEKGYIIRVCNLELEKCARVVSASSDVTIDALNLDPESGWMFWSETSWSNFKDSKCILKRAEMSGANQISIVEHDLRRVTDVAVDSFHHVIYWADHSTKRIERADYNGSNRELLYKSKHSVTDVALFEDYVYWSIGKSQMNSYNNHMSAIGRCGLYGAVHSVCDFVRLLPANSNLNIERLRILQPAIQLDGDNVCEGVKCSHLCVKSTVGHTCLCEDGTKLRHWQECTARNETSGPNFVKANEDEKNESNWGKWFFVFLILIGAGGGLTYLGLHYLPWFKGAKTGLTRMQFQNPIFELGSAAAHRMSRFHPSRLIPGQHQYENPLKDQNSKSESGEIKDRSYLVPNSWAVQSSSESLES